MPLEVIFSQNQTSLYVYTIHLSFQRKLCVFRFEIINFYTNENTGLKKSMFA